MAAASWVRTITSPFRKACTYFNPHHHQQSNRDLKRTTSQPQQGSHEHWVKDLQGEVMACGYEDVQVMWSILDKSNSSSNLAP